MFGLKKSLLWRRLRRVLGLILRSTGFFFILQVFYIFWAKLSWFCIPTSHLSPRAQRLYQQFKLARIEMKH